MITIYILIKSPFILNEISFTLIPWHLDLDLWEINILNRLSCLLQPFFIVLLCLSELLPHSAINNVIN